MADEVLQEVIGDIDFYLPMLFSHLPVHRQRECLLHVYKRRSDLPETLDFLYEKTERKMHLAKEELRRQEKVSNGEEFCKLAEMPELTGRVRFELSISGKPRDQFERVYEKPDDDERSYRIDIQVFLDGKRVVHFLHTDHWHLTSGRDHSYEFEHDYSESVPPVFDVPGEDLYRWQQGLEKFLRQNTAYYRIYRRNVIEWQADDELKPQKPARIRRPAAWQKDMVLDGPPAKKRRRS